MAWKKRKKNRLNIAVQQRFSQDVLAKNDAVQLNKHSVKSQSKKKTDIHQPTFHSYLMEDLGQRYSTSQIKKHSQSTDDVLQVSH